MNKKWLLNKMIACVMSVTILVGVAQVSNGDRFSLSVKAADLSKINNPEKRSDGHYVWDCVYFGDYIQTYTAGTVIEPIKWRVLSAGETSFLIADQVLDAHEFHNTIADVAWENSDIRTWLNIDFYNKAFSSSEKDAILTTTVKNGFGNNDTQDKVYLLSAEEATTEAYGFPGDLEGYDDKFLRISLGTNYAGKNGLDMWLGGTYTTSVVGEWWLRTVDSNSGKPYKIDSDACGKPYFATANSVGVRPVISLDMTKADWVYAGKVCSDGKPVTENNSPVNPSPTEQPTTKPTTKPTSKPTSKPTTKPGDSPLKGITFTVGMIQYKILTANEKKKTGTVTVNRITNKKVIAYVIPEVVYDNGIAYKVTTIGPRSFSKCNSLFMIEIGNNVTRIETYAFEKCKKLKTVNVKSTKITKVGKNAFEGAKYKLKCPKKCMKKYKKLFK